MTRKDYLNDPNAPKANSIAVACSAFVQDEQGRVLLIRRMDNKLCSIPGGQLELGETLGQAIVREVREETGIEVHPTGVIGIYSNPGHVIEYDNGEVRQEFSICFRAKRIGGVERTSEESSEVMWATPHELHMLQIHPSTRLRIEHALDHSRDTYFT